MSRQFDPFHELSPRKYHFWAKVNQHGDVSALCYAKPRKIPAHEQWTNRREAVTCRRCLKLLTAT